jgi:hypothetical protein
MMPFQPSTRDYAALAARIRAVARPPLRLRVSGQQTAGGGTERYDLFLVQIPAVPTIAAIPTGRRPRWRVYLNGGTHGDEPAGTEAVTRFLEEKRYRAWPDVAFTVTPCLNPWGYAHNRRRAPAGATSTAASGGSARATPEISAHRRPCGRAFDPSWTATKMDAPALRSPAPGQAIVGVRPLGPAPWPRRGRRDPQDSVVVLTPATAPPAATTLLPVAPPVLRGHYHHRASAGVAGKARLSRRTCGRWMCHHRNAHRAVSTSA